MTGVSLLAVKFWYHQFSTPAQGAYIGDEQDMFLFGLAELHFPVCYAVKVTVSGVR